MMLRPPDHGSEFAAILTDQSNAATERWRAFSRMVLNRGPDVDVLAALFAAIVSYDDVFARHCARPVEVPIGTVTVSGSGKETFKTFNVSTAAALLAAACGVPVVKGVSRSVSATTGAHDILDHLGIEVATSPSTIAPLLDRFGIAFVDYRAFCPRFFNRYDGTFVEIQPTSLFMPAAALMVKGAGFVHGLASPKTEISAHTIVRARSDARRGVVVCTEIAPGHVIDENASVGTIWRSDLAKGQVTSRTIVTPPADDRWMAAVAHRATHRANADTVARILAGNASAAVTDLVYDNAALVIEVATGKPYQDARADTVDTHRSGSALRLMHRLQIIEHDAIYV